MTNVEFLIAASIIPIGSVLMGLVILFLTQD